MTEKLYHRDAYQPSFKARVEAILPGEERAVVLDRTCFYPESGGQPWDLGRLGEARVTRVIEREGEVVHFLSGPLPAAGQEVEGEIDWERRFDHMQHHTGQHILSQAFLRHLGAATLSFHLGSESVTIDLDREALTPQEIYAVEDLANQVIFSDQPILIHQVPPEDIARWKLRKVPARAGVLRVIEIGEFDRTACGGTHCRHTGEVGLLKIRRWTRVKKRARVEFRCGRRALLDYRWKNRAIYQLSQLLAVEERRVLEGATRQAARLRDLARQLQAAKERLLELEAERLAQDSFEKGAVQVVSRIVPHAEQEHLVELARRLVSGVKGRLVLLGAREPRVSLVLARSEDLSWDLSAWIARAAPLIEGRGGGTPREARASGQRAQGLEEAIEFLLAELPV